MTEIDYTKINANVSPVVEIMTQYGLRRIALTITLSNYSYTDGKYMPDCEVGHFGYNFFVRTRAGMQKRKYSSEELMKREVEKLLRKHNIKFIKWIEFDDRNSVNI